MFSCLWERGQRLRCTHTMHSLTCVLVVVCVVRKPRPCLSYIRCRDRMNSVLWCSYYKGGGAPQNPFERHIAGSPMSSPRSHIGCPALVRAPPRSTPHISRRGTWDLELHLNAPHDEPKPSLFCCIPYARSFRGVQTAVVALWRHLRHLLGTAAPRVRAWGTNE